VRLKNKGLTHVLCSAVKYMYKSDFSAPPRRAIRHLEQLVDVNFSLVEMPVGSKQIM
jgi:hypothetical protein